MQVGQDTLSIEHGDWLYRFCLPAGAELVWAHLDRYLAPGVAVGAE